MQENEEGIVRIIADLQVLASLSAGKTLSPSTMTILDHNSWSGAVWRTYSGENRKQTLSHIKKIFDDALFLIASEDFSQPAFEEILSMFDLAVAGVSTLKETYKGDFYTIADLESMITVAAASSLRLRKNREDGERETPCEAPQDLVQKIHPASDFEGRMWHSSSSVEQVVQVPDRGGDEKCVDETADDMYCIWDPYVNSEEGVPPPEEPKKIPLTIDCHQKVRSKKSSHSQDFLENASTKWKCMGWGLEAVTLPMYLCGVEKE